MKHFKINFIFLFAFVILIFNGCKTGNREFSEKDVALSWAEMTIFITKNTPANTPTNASRALGYIGLTMYESIVPGFKNYNSVANQVNQLKDFPKIDTSQKYNWAISLNTAEAEILRNIYNQTSDTNKLKIDSLENVFEDYFSTKIDDDLIINRSKSFGKSIAKSIYEWSKTDGGHRAYLKNFDKKLVFSQKKGGWKPPLYAQSISHYPLHPHWGKNRTFLLENSQLSDPQFIGYSVDPKSDYYKQFLAVYNKNNTLTQQEKEAAIWWGDDPDETPTPPGHSYYLAAIAARKSDADLIKTAETFAKVGMGVADAFRDCWKWKYQFFSERPNTYITEHIDKNWVSFWPDPPFPAFPSGHAIQAAATATVLTDLYGEKFNIIDSVHVGRHKDDIRDVEFKVRTFNSFWEVANETANSRFYGGIHTPQDNNAGLAKGKEIGANINHMKWKK